MKIRGQQNNGFYAVCTNPHAELQYVYPSDTSFWLYSHNSSTGTFSCCEHLNGEILNALKISTAQYQLSVITSGASGLEV